MEIFYTSLHRIDHRNNLVQKIAIPKSNLHLQTYIQGLLSEITEKQNDRLFKFERTTTEVRSAIDKYLQSDAENASSIIATRLLDAEQKAQKRIDRLDKEIQKGSLFQTYIEKDGVKIIVISKADHSDFLDEIDFSPRSGLPLKKRVYKATAIEIGKNSDVDNVYVYDTNPSEQMAMYWWRDFLELSEIYQDAYNTRIALTLLNRKIFNPIKEEYPSDHTYLLNSSLSYFRSKTDFILSEYIDWVFENYDPINASFPKQDYINKVKKISASHKYKFDNRFTIEKSEIKQRMRQQKIVLSENIELVLNDAVENLKEIIKPGEEPDKRKYIKIYSDVGYNKFKVKS